MFTQNMIPQDLKFAEINAAPSEHGDDKIIQLTHHPTGWGRSVLLSEIEDELKVKLGLKKAGVKASAPEKADTTKTSDESPGS